MSAQSTLDVGRLRPLLAEFGIRGTLTTTNTGECRLECPAAHVAANRVWLEWLFRFEVLLVRRYGGRSVIWFRVRDDATAQV